MFFISLLRLTCILCVRLLTFLSYGFLKHVVSSVTDIIGLVYTSCEFIVDAILVGRFIDVIFLVVVVGQKWVSATIKKRKILIHFSPMSSGVPRSDVVGGGRRGGGCKTTCLPTMTSTSCDFG